MTRVKPKLWKDVSDKPTAALLLERYEAMLRDKIREYDAMTPADFRKLGIKHRDPRTPVIRQLAMEDGVAYATMKCKLSLARQTMELKAATLTTILKYEGVETFGLPVPDAWKQSMKHVRNKYWSVSSHITSLVRSLETVCEAHQYPARYREPLKNALAESQRRLLEFAPCGLCRYCKGLEPYQSECTWCERTGIGVKSVTDACPEELQREHPLKVMWRGKIVEAQR